MSQDPQKIDTVQKHLHRAVEVMRKFPPNYVPDNNLFEEFPDGLGAELEYALSQDSVRSKLEEIMSGWPTDLFSTFVLSGDLIGQLLRMYGVHTQESLSFEQTMMAAFRDPEIGMLMRYSIDDEETKENSLEKNNIQGKRSEALNKALYKEIQRRLRFKSIPFSKVITTLLGPDALEWLTSISQDGIIKLQPHEFSRTGWHSLSCIGDQIAIEQELLYLDKSNAENAKILVALCWSMVSLASFMEPAIFLGESDIYLSSQRQGGLTWSQGRSTHTLITFDPSSMIGVINILNDALIEDDISACDMMWIATGLAKVLTVKAGNSESIKPFEEHYNLFLSHRGKDSKQILFSRLLELNKQDGVFLDCLSLPHGVVNRKFLFDSLSHSDSVVIVQTPNYYDSEWCRKELWLAEAMAKFGLGKIKKFSLDDTKKSIEQLSPVNSHSNFEKLDYDISPRILRDIDNSGRTPNKNSLQVCGFPSNVFEPINEFLNRKPSPEEISLIESMILDLFSAVERKTSWPKPLEPWSLAMQYAVAAFGITSYARSKVEVREGIDQLNSILCMIASKYIADDLIFKKNFLKYLIFVSIAVMINISHFAIEPQMEEIIKNIVKGVAVLHKGLLLLDVRYPGPIRDFNLKLIMGLVENNIGSVGIVQLAIDTVHEKKIDGDPLDNLPIITLYKGKRTNGKSLDILPCITLHKGMEKMFPEFA